MCTTVRWNGDSVCFLSETGNQVRLGLASTLGKDTDFPSCALGAKITSQDRRRLLEIQKVTAVVQNVEKANV